MFKWFVIIAACFLVMMYVEEVPAQEPVIIYTPMVPTGVVCIEIAPGVYDCQ